MTPPLRAAGARRVLVFALALLAWCALYARAAQVFAPDGFYVQPFNSDSALPVLMANDPVVDPFRLYVYGQDQIGAWHTLPLQLIHRATGFAWTDRGVFRVQLFWLLLSLAAIALLAPRAAALAASLFAAVLCLHPTVSHYLFVLNQRYAWHTTALLLAWWSLRRLSARQLGAETTASGPARPAFAPFAASFFFCLLATWNSALSVPMLLALLALEAARARLLSREAPRATRLVPSRLLACALPLVAAFAAERLLKAVYHRHALKHFGQDFATPTAVDWGHLFANFKAQAHNLVAAPAWWLTLLAVLAAALLCYRLLRCFARDPRGFGSDFCRGGARLDLSVLVVGCAAVAAVNFAGSFLFLWMRLNAYGPRYLAETHLFGAFAGLVALCLFVTSSAQVRAARRAVFPALAFACLLTLALKFPPARKNPEYGILQAVAAGLAARAPRAVLLGGYWDTYVFAALRPDALVTPVPAEDQLLRTPWTPQLVREAREVLIVHHARQPSPEAEALPPYDTFGDGQDPPPVVRQYGATLRLAAPRWYESGGYVFTLYRNESLDGAR
ncbi:MAG TPA: hypothetical protein VF538_12595 [Pyrinomonadaceae bacterium]